MPRWLLVALLGLAACAPPSAVPLAPADETLYLEWATYQSSEMGGDRLYLQGWSEGGRAEAVRLLDAAGVALAEAPSSESAPDHAAGCLRRESGAPLVALPFDAAAAMALNAGRIEARVSGVWVKVVLASRGCHATD